MDQAEKNPLLEQISIGQVWCGHEILEQLGRGGMGVVYKARPEGTNRIVALKAMLSGSESQGRRFLREAQATAKMAHPNIIKVYAMGSERGRFYFTMEYIAGMTFEMFIAQDAPLEEKIDILIKIAAALQHAHDRKILHRDLKPSNILLDESREPYLSDFGLAKMLDRNTQLTETGQVLGTPFYMSPEQILGTKKITAASDVYSLGVVLYQALTGALPFTADTVGTLSAKIIFEEPLPLHLHNPDLPAALDAICRKVLEKSPGLRYASASALGRDLLRFREGQKVEATRFEARRALAYGYRYLMNSPWVLVAIALAVIAGTFVFWPRADWKRHWDAAQKAFADGDYAQSLEYLRQIQGHSKQVAGLQKNIEKKVEKIARECFQKQDYGKALDCLQMLPQSGREAVKLKAEILDARGQNEEMRLELARLYELQPGADDLRFMGEKALKWAYYPDAARYFRAALKAHPDSDLFNRRLAQVLVHWGKYREAKALCLSSLAEDPATAPVLAMIYYGEGQYGKSLLEVEKVKGGESDRERAEILFLKARIRWRLREKDLMRWDWLSSRDTSELQRALDDIESQLQMASEALSAAPPRSLEGNLREDIRMHIEAIGLERGLHPDRGDAADLSVKTRIFFKQVEIRSRIRAGSWREALAMCDAAVEEFPWVAGLYHLRSLANFHCDLVSDAMEDLERALVLDKADFIPLENLTVLIATRMTQEEYNEFTMKIVNMFIYKPAPSAPTMIFERCLDELREEMWQSENFLSVPPAEEKNWRPLLSRLLESDSASVVEMVAEILAVHHRHAGLQDEIRRIEDKVVNREERAKLQKLRTAMARREKMEDLTALEYLLYKYAVLREERYILQVYRSGQAGEELLEEIFCDDERAAVTRLLAALMMLACGRGSALSYLQETAKSGDCPANLLAAVALKETGFPAAIPEISPPFFPGENPERTLFYRMLLALHWPAAREVGAAFSLLGDPDPLVSLCAAYNLRRLPLLSGQREAVDQKLVELLRSGDPYVRSLACSVFWDFFQWGESDTPAGNDKYRRECWRKYHELLLPLLKDPVLEVQWATISSIVRDMYVKSGPNIGGRVPEIANTPSAAGVIEVLRGYYRSPSYFANFWSAVLLSTLEEKRKVWAIINDLGVPLFVRMACARMLWMTDRVNLYELAMFLSKFLEDPERSRSDPGFKQYAILILGWYCAGLFQQYGEMMINEFHGKILPAIADPDIRIKTAAASALLWCGKYGDVKTLRPYLDADNRHLQRAAAASMAGLTIRFRPRDIPALQKSLQSYPDHVKKAAAYGYCELIRLDTNVSFRMLIDVDMTKRYDLYLRYCEAKIAKMTQEEIERWRLALLSAMELDPSSTYRYEYALLSYKTALAAGKRVFPDAHAKLEEALKSAGTEGRIPHHKVRCLYLRGLLYRDGGEVEKARRDFEEVVRLDPFHSGAHYEMGRMCQDETALDHFWHAYVLDPNHRESLFAIAKTHLQRGETRQALKILKEYQAQFGLRYTDLADRVFDAVRGDPWILSLPR